jgi:hypothetical protein
MCAFVDLKLNRNVSMIDATQKKLREARFFAQMLGKVNRQPGLNEPEEFEFYLSGFLSAARAVTFTLQYEAKDKYDAWSPAWFSSRGPEDQALLKDMITHRNSVQKRGGAETDQDWVYIPVTETRIRMENRHPSYGFHWYGPPETPPPTFGTLVFSFKGSGCEVISACEKYLTILDSLVREFIDTYRQ